MFPTMKATVCNNEWKDIILNYIFFKLQWDILLKQWILKRFQTMKATVYNNERKDVGLYYVLFKFQWQILLKQWTKKIFLTMKFWKNFRTMKVTV